MVRNSKPIVRKKVYNHTGLRMRVKKVYDQFINLPLIRRFRQYSTKKKIIVTTSAAVGMGLIIAIGTFAYYARAISDPERLMNHNNTGIALLDKHGEVFYSRGVVKDFKQVKLADMSPHLPKALVASEDKNFYTDPGFSVRGMSRALFNNVKETDLTGSGGSGITQQLVKNNLLTTDKNFLRKYQELCMAIAIEQRYTKDEILEMYLNSVYYGNDAFGIENAAQTYFGKSAKDLDLAESAMLIGILPAPSAYAPTNGDEEKAEKRQAYVLSRMQDDTYITSEEEKNARDQQLTYIPPEEIDDGNAHHFALMVIDELNEKYGEERIIRSGFRVKTSLDLGWQKTAEEAVAKQIQTLAIQDARNGSLVAIDPSTGEIRALVGSADWNNTEYGKVNMAITPRQPGSSFKPIYYTEAIDKRKLTAATILEDKPTDFGGGYRPTNYDFRYRGDVTVRYALANSLNIPAVKVMEMVGVEASAKTAQRMGISTINEPEKYGLSLALGTAEARLLDMTNAYASLAKGGDQYTATSISEIKDKFDDSVYQYKPKAQRVMGKEASYIMSSILSDEQARAPLAGSRFNIGRPAAVKTGTTNDSKDAWTIGYTPQVAIGVWVGNNDNTPMRGVGGSLGAGPIWRSAMTSFMRGAKVEQFPQPSGVVQMQVCNNNTTTKEYFVRGTEGPFKCAEPQKPQEETKKPEDDEENKPKNDDAEEGQENLPQNPEETDGGETTPTEPTDPGDGTTPTEPTDPTVPTEPTDPGDGTTPTEPTTP